MHLVIFAVKILLENVIEYAHSLQRHKAGCSESEDCTFCPSSNLTLLLLAPDSSSSSSDGDISPFTFPLIIKHRHYFLLIVSPFLSEMSNPNQWGYLILAIFNKLFSTIFLIIPITCKTSYLKINTFHLHFSFWSLHLSPSGSV